MPAEELAAFVQRPLGGRGIAQGVDFQQTTLTFKGRRRLREGTIERWTKIKPIIEVR